MVSEITVWSHISGCLTLNKKPKRGRFSCRRKTYRRLKRSVLTAVWPRPGNWGNYHRRAWINFTQYHWRGWRQSLRHRHLNRRRRPKQTNQFYRSSISSVHPQLKWSTSATNSITEAKSLGKMLLIILLSCDTIARNYAHNSITPDENYVTASCWAYGTIAYARGCYVRTIYPSDRLSTKIKSWKQTQQQVKHMTHWSTPYRNLA